NISAKWAHAHTHPIPPEIVSSAPCQEMVLEGQALLDAGGVGMLPVPISTPGFDCAPFLSSGHWVTKDPDTGDHNFGTYRAQIKSPNRIGLMGFGYQDVTKHWSKHKTKGKPMEAAVVIGCTPNLSYCSTARITGPEYPVAGGIAGEPIQLVHCKTVDLMVPAHSEIVIEGIVPTDVLEREAPFGEFTGYMAQSFAEKFMNVNCITRRHKPIFQAFLSQLPPSESSILRGVALEGVFYKLLTVDKKMKGILEVSLPDHAGSHMVGVVRMKTSEGTKPMDALRAIAEFPRAVPKLLVAVDEDIDARDAESVNWAMSYRMQPHRDVTICRTAPSTGLDFSLAPPDAREDAGDMNASSILVDATIKWHYPPISLPKKEYMDKAISIWKELGLPQLQLKTPWYGYSLGHWSEQDVADAERAVRGEHYTTGKLREKERIKS
ncbi:MAG: UbiD family decarboxylase, partial [Candidatus Binatia bacterium]|nr:UbiD family decarboxylase [Candidatus Binatia bacterium]